MLHVNLPSTQNMLFIPPSTNLIVSWTKTSICYSHTDVSNTWDNWKERCGSLWGEPGCDKLIYNPCFCSRDKFALPAPEAPESSLMGWCRSPAVRLHPGLQCEPRLASFTTSAFLRVSFTWTFGFVPFIWGGCGSSTRTGQRLAGQSLAAYQHILGSELMCIQKVVGLLINIYYKV